MLKIICRILDSFSTKNELSMQKYVESKRPQTIFDVERFTTEYQRTLGRKSWN